MIKSQNIIIKDSSNINSIYRCEFREIGTHDFIEQFYQVGSEVSGYMTSIEDDEYNQKNLRHQVFSRERNFMYYMSRPEEDAKNLGKKFATLPALECRLYRPANAISGDAIVIVKTRINGRYLQLFGGLYSECEMNSYEVIRDNCNSYSEYIYFYIPTELITNQPFTAISVDLIPISDLLGGQYQLSTEYTPDDISFVWDLQVHLRAEVFNNVFGEYGVRVTTDITHEQFDSYYRSVYQSLSNLQRDDVQESLTNPKYHLSLLLFDSTEFSADHLKYSRLVQRNIKYTEELKNEPLIDEFLPINEGLLRTREPDTYFQKLENLQFRVAQEDVEDTVTEPVSWENVPDILQGLVVITLTYIDSMGETGLINFESNIFTIIKDDLKYLIDKPRILNLTGSFPNSYKDFYDNYMLNLNITAKHVEETPAQLRVKNPVSVIYKPIFFKTQSLDTVNLTRGLTQRIGINLQEYETKVSTFRLRIGDISITESERTDMYVIFKVDASKLDPFQRKYHILDQDFEYLTSGKLVFS